MEEMVYNGSDIGNKGFLIMKNHKKENNPIKVTSSFLADKPTKEDIQKLQKEVQHILLSSIQQNTIQSK